MLRRIATNLNRRPVVGKMMARFTAQGAFPAGHYYSPIPAREEVLAQVRARQPPDDEVVGIPLDPQGQFALLSEFAQFYDELPFTQTPGGPTRYHYRNPGFGHSDAIFLYGMLRKLQPARIIEVGGGYSSAVMLDTIDHVFQHRPEMTIIEPYPRRLHSLLREGDLQRLRLIDRKVQDVPDDTFGTLGSGDLLFIDSSHVVKCGSDLEHLMFEIIPRLRPGVFVHFHDIFYPFQYPAQWLVNGRYWNENYVLRAFLTNNSQWKVRFFCSFVHHMFGDTLRAQMPLCATGPGGSLYIQRDEPAPSEPAQPGGDEGPAPAP